MEHVQCWWCQRTYGCRGFMVLVNELFFWLLPFCWNGVSSTGSIQDSRPQLFIFWTFNSQSFLGHEPCLWWTPTQTIFNSITENTNIQVYFVGARISSVLGFSIIVWSRYTLSWPAWEILALMWCWADYTSMLKLVLWLINSAKARKDVRSSLTFG